MSSGKEIKKFQDVDQVFDSEHYASTFLEKIKRSLQLGAKYYFLDVPRYFFNRRKEGLPFWDAGVVVNPLREFRHRIYYHYPLPDFYDQALQRIADTGIRLSLPPHRLESVVGAWWSTREVAGQAIECGSYRGATGLLLGLLGEMGKIDQQILLLDTFSGTPPTSNYDSSRQQGEFTPADDQVSIIRQQAIALGIEERVVIHKGLFADTFSAIAQQNLNFAFAHIDANVYWSTKEACEFVLPRMASDSIIVLDDYNGVTDLGARLAIDRYFLGKVRQPIPLAGCSAFLRIADIRRGN